MKIYVASSRLNDRQPEVVAKLRAEGHDPYDFRNSAPGNHGFSWRDLDPEWQSWSLEEFRDRLNDPIAQNEFANNFAAMSNADAFVLVLPCGRSAHLEVGWAIGRGIPTAILLDRRERVQAQVSEPELMYSLVGTGGKLCVNLDECTEWLRNHEISKSLNNLANAWNLKRA